MEYDFDTPADRRGTDSVKWDVDPGELAMWVADMDFKTAPEITEEFHKRISHGIFGYAGITDEWYDAYTKWWKIKHNLDMDREALIFCTGVVPAISSIIRKLTTPDEKVLVLTPVYNIFFNSIINNGCRPLECPLRYEKGLYKIDFDLLKSNLSDPQCTMMILCNPHNPTGRIWSKDELLKIGKLCREFNVTVISDEIHCDIVRPGKEYVPFAGVSEECAGISITCIAPTKAFNLAGLQSAACYVPDSFLRHKVWRALNTDEIAEPGSFAQIAATAAFNLGERWLRELNEYLFHNRDTAVQYINNNISCIKPVNGDATYLLWMDIGELDSDSTRTASGIRTGTGLYLSDGAAYGKAGAGFLRMNIACPESVMMDGLERLKQYAGSRL